jgi:hypothetical protein
MLLSLFILSPASSHPIVKGSAIVGQPAQGAERVLVYYEGNLYGAENLKAYEERVQIAAGRLTQHYPTVARSSLRKEELICVGSFDTQAHLITVDEPDLLEAWAGERVETSVTRWERDRELHRRYKEHLRTGKPIITSDLMRT